MLVNLEALHSYVLQGNSECHVFEAAPSSSGGKVFKNLIKESTRDHVDLLLSCKYWPVVYVVDMACDVAHTEVRKPDMANTLWGDRRGYFERPQQGETPKVLLG